MKLLKKIKFFTVYLVLVFLGLEISLRLLGYQSIVNGFYQNGPKYHEVDSRLGWKLIPGEYVVPINIYGDSMSLTIKQGVGRITQTNRLNQVLDKVVFLGGSFTMGRGVNDDRTSIWKVQERFPELDIRNLGVGAYGTYQSLMVLEQETKKEDKPKVVFYGLIENHKYRNVAQAQWLEGLYYNSYQVRPKLPYVSLGENGEVIRQPPKMMTKLPLSEYLITVLMLERATNRLKSYKNEKTH